MKENINSSMRLVAILLSFILCGCVPSIIKKACFTGSCIDVEVVDNDTARSRGLMYRDRLLDTQGMLFIFPEDAVYSFWMKNMRFALDILWVDHTRRIVDIHTFVPACTTTTCQSYKPCDSVRYVLEVNAGFVNGHHLKRGDTVEFK